MEFSKLKRDIFPKFIRTEGNEERLKDRPKKEYFEFTLIFYVLILDGDVRLEVQVGDDLMKSWKLSYDELYECAMKNAQRDMPANLTAICPDPPKEMRTDKFPTPEDGVRCMYMLSNRKTSYGAVCILYPNVLKMIGEYLQDDFYLMPSSVHEMMLMPKSFDVPKKLMLETIHDMNVQMADKEVLGYEPLWYSRERDCLLTVD
jgi:hypothetical protein